MSKRFIGSVKWFNTAKGYGIIERKHDSEVFVHADEIEEGPFSSLIVGDKVEFTILEGKDGPKAHEVQLILE
ncbi:MAG: cold shock domain-containing protein [Candidatus Dadabacteria bacterium]|nr:cold shock domain-containing protein [Candidatus Dadabacteria bacterium]